MALRRLGLLGVMAALTAAAAYVGARLAGPDGAVVGAVSGVAISALGETARRWFDRLEDRRRLRTRVFLPETAMAIKGSELSPAALLAPEQATVPFIGRKKELLELINWCVDRSPDPLRLLVGAGGTGKTRLVRELAAGLNGWDCRWVQHGQEGDAIDAARRRKSLIVVDYAETRPRGSLIRLVTQLAWPPRQGVRVLLIARAVGDWWAELGGETQTLRERTVLQNAKRTTLHALAYDHSIFEQHLHAAIRAFCEKLSASLPPTATVDLHHDASILMIHIAALVAVLESGDQSHGQQGEVLSRLLDHEDRYWQRSAKSHGLTWLSRAARCQSVAELCLSGATVLADAAELLKRIPELADSVAAPRYGVARWLQDLYPGEGANQLSSLRPHLLAEYLVVRELAADAEFADHALHDLSVDVARHALITLGYAAEHEQRAIPLALEVITADPVRMIPPAVSAAVETGVSLDTALAAQIPLASLDLLQLARISAAIPLKSKSLDRTAVVVRKRLVETGEEELMRLRKPSVDHNELERRQVELMEFARVLKDQQGTVPPATIHANLLTALQVQKDVLTASKWQSEVESISKEIAWIKSNRPVW
jgi:hypothetical protein